MEKQKIEFEEISTGGGFYGYCIKYLNNAYYITDLHGFLPKGNKKFYVNVYCDNMDDQFYTLECGRWSIKEMKRVVKLLAKKRPWNEHLGPNNIEFGVVKKDKIIPYKGE